MLSLSHHHFRILVTSYLKWYLTSYLKYYVLDTIETQKLRQFSSSNEVTYPNIKHFSYFYFVILEQEIAEEAPGKLQYNALCGPLKNNVRNGVRKFPS